MFQCFNNLTVTEIKNVYLILKILINPLTAGAADVRVFIFLAHYVPHNKYVQDKM